jgi:hypothetical protein
VDDDRARKEGSFIRRRHSIGIIHPQLIQADIPRHEDSPSFWSDRYHLDHHDDYDALLERYWRRDDIACYKLAAQRKFYIVRDFREKRGRRWRSTLDYVSDT